MMKSSNDRSATADYSYISVTDGATDNETWYFDVNSVITLTVGKRKVQITLDPESGAATVCQFEPNEGDLRFDFRDAKHFAFTDKITVFA